MQISALQCAPETALDQLFNPQLNPKTVEFSALRASQVLAQQLRSRDGSGIPHSPAPPDARPVSSSGPRKANSQQP